MLRALDGVKHGGESHGLHTHHFHGWPERLGHGGHTGYQTAAANRHNERIEIGHVLQHLQGYRSLAGNDGVIVVGVHKGQLALLGQREGVVTGFFQRVAMQYDLGSKTACALYLDARCEARHHDDSM